MTLDRRCDRLKIAHPLFVQPLRADFGRRTDDDESRDDCQKDNGARGDGKEGGGVQLHAPASSFRMSARK